MSDPRFGEPRKADRDDEYECLDCGYTDVLHNFVYDSDEDSWTCPSCGSDETGLAT